MRPRPRAAGVFVQAHVCVRARVTWGKNGPACNSFRDWLPGCGAHAQVLRRPFQLEDAGPALTIDTASGQGIPGHITSLGHEPHHYVTFYVQVDDLPAYLTKAESLGGKTLVPPVEVPGRGHFAWLADPDGSIIGLWKLKA